MSTLSGELNSLAAASVVDFYRRLFHPQGNDAHFLLVSRLLTVLWGGFAVVIALWAGQLGSAIEVVNRFGSYFYGSILGVFGLAVLAPRSNGRGALAGLGDWNGCGDGNGALHLRQFPLVQRRWCRDGIRSGRRGESLSGTSAASPEGEGADRPSRV